jgi:hypothetical protein
MGEARSPDFLRGRVFPFLGGNLEYQEIWYFSERGIPPIGVITSNGGSHKIHPRPSFGEGSVREMCDYLTFQGTGPSLEGGSSKIMQTLYFQAKGKTVVFTDYRSGVAGSLSPGRPGHHKVILRHFVIPGIRGI